jgi:hypothetical protein
MVASISLSESKSDE